MRGALGQNSLAGIGRTANYQNQPRYTGVYPTTGSNDHINKLSGIGGMSIPYGARLSFNDHQELDDYDYLTYTGAETFDYMAETYLFRRKTSSSFPLTCSGYDETMGQVTINPSNTIFTSYPIVLSFVYYDYECQSDLNPTGITTYSYSFNVNQDTSTTFSDGDVRFYTSGTSTAGKYEDVGIIMISPVDRTGYNLNGFLKFYQQNVSATNLKLKVNIIWDDNNGGDYNDTVYELQMGNAGDTVELPFPQKSYFSGQPLSWATDTTYAEDLGPDKESGTFNAFPDTGCINFRSDSPWGIAKVSGLTDEFNITGLGTYYHWDVNTTDTYGGFPGLGKMAFNNTTIANSTEMTISKFDNLGENRYSTFLSLQNNWEDDSGDYPEDHKWMIRLTKEYDVKIDVNSCSFSGSGDSQYATLSINPIADSGRYATDISLISGGADYSALSNQSTSTNEMNAFSTANRFDNPGSGLTVNTTVNGSGGIIAASINQSGDNNYVVGESVTIDGNTGGSADAVLNVIGIGGSSLVDGTSFGLRMCPKKVKVYYRKWAEGGETDAYIGIGTVTITPVSNYEFDYAHFIIRPNVNEDVRIWPKWYSADGDYYSYKCKLVTPRAGCIMHFDALASTIETESDHRKWYDISGNSGDSPCYMRMDNMTGSDDYSTSEGGYFQFNMGTDGSTTTSPQYGYYVREDGSGARCQYAYMPQSQTANYKQWTYTVMVIAKFMVDNKDTSPVITPYNDGVTGSQILFSAAQNNITYTSAASNTFNSQGYGLALAAGRRWNSFPYSTSPNFYMFNGDTNPSNFVDLGFGSDENPTPLWAMYVGQWCTPYTSANMHVVRQGRSGIDSNLQRAANSSGSRYVAGTGYNSTSLLSIGGLIINDGTWTNSDVIMRLTGRIGVVKVWDYAVDATELNTIYHSYKGRYFDV